MRNPPLKEKKKENGKPTHYTPVVAHCRPSYARPRSKHCLKAEGRSLTGVLTISRASFFVEREFFLVCSYFLNPLFKSQPFFLVLFGIVVSLAATGTDVTVSSDTHTTRLSERDLQQEPNVGKKQDTNQNSRSQSTPIGDFFVFAQPPCDFDNKQTSKHFFLPVGLFNGYLLSTMAAQADSSGQAPDAAVTNNTTTTTSSASAQTPAAEPQKIDNSSQVPAEQGVLTSDTDASASQTSEKEAPPKTIDAPEDARTALESTIIVLALCIALFLAALDMSIITTAVPTIVAHFNSSTGYVWVGSAYLLGNAAFVATWGKVSDIFGRKTTLLVAVGVFLVGSLLCALSQSMGMLIAARAIQGIGGGGTILLPNICVADLFSVRKRGMYFGIFGMVWAIAGALGPIIGGLFTSKVSWRWCFWINLPTGGVAFLILVFFLKLHNPRTPLKEGLLAIDWTGNLLVIGGTLMVLIGLEFGGVQFAWNSATVICLIVFGIVTLAIFGFYIAKIAKFPVVPLRVFQYQNCAPAYLLSIMHAMAFMGTNYYLPLYFQAVLGANSLMSGVYLLPFVITLSVISFFSGMLIKKTGNFRIPIVSGLFVMTIGLGLMIGLGSRPNWAKIIIFQMIAGMGVGPNFQAPLIAIQANIEPRDIGAATSSFQFARQIGTSVAVTVGGAIFNNIMNKQQGLLRTALTPEQASLFTGDHAAASITIIDTLPNDRNQIQTVKDAYWNALQTMYIFFTCVCFVGLVISGWIRQATLSKNHTEHKTGLQTLKKEERVKKNAPDEERPEQAQAVSEKDTGKSN